jgi:guanylate kinase
LAAQPAIDQAAELLRELLEDDAIRARCASGNAQIQQVLTGRSPRLFIISGPSGVGKDSVIEKLQGIHASARYVVTATSRTMRDEEKDGVHYLFLERADFERRIANGEFIEYAEVYENLYGVPRRPIEEGLANGQDVIVKVDVQGAATLRRLIANTISIFLMPESMEALLQRLVYRKTEERGVVERRFKTACEELQRVGEFDYIVFNEAGKLKEALAGILGIVDAEKAKVEQARVSVG